MTAISSFSKNPKVMTDPLKFRDERRYTDRLRDAKTKTGLEDAILNATPAKSMVCRSSRRFRILPSWAVRLAWRPAKRSSRVSKRRYGSTGPLVLFAASGGARMQEGILSLMPACPHDGCRRSPEGSRPALCRGADQPHHGRRDGLLCHAGRRATLPSPAL